MLILRLASSYFKRRKLRVTLTILSIAIAVAAVLAIQGLSGSINVVASEIVGLLGGKAQLEVKGAIAGMDSSYLQKAKSIDEVKDAVPFVQSITQVKEFTYPLHVLGIDSQEDKKIRSYKIIKGRMPIQGKREVIIPKKIIQGKNIKNGDYIELQEVNESKKYQIVGVLDDTGAARVNGGEVIFMPLDTAQKALGLDHKYSYISLVLYEPEMLEGVKTKLVESLGPDVEIRPPQARSQDLDNFFGMILGFYNLMGSISLFLALFVVYNTIKVAVTEQKEQLGILRALGWTKKETRQLVIAEAMIIGVLGSSVGILLGKPLASALLASSATSMQEWVKINLDQVNLNVIDYLMAWLVGVVSTLTSAWIPAYKASKDSPIEAIRGDDGIGEKGYGKARLAIGLILLMITFASVEYGSKNPLIFQSGIIVLLIGFTLLLPPLIVKLFNWLEIILRNSSGFSVKLGLSSARRSPRKIVITGLPILLGLAISLSFLSLNYSIQETMKDWMDDLMVEDIVVNQGLQVSGMNTTALPESIVPEISKVKGVDKATAFRFAKINWNKHVVDLVAVDVEVWKEFAKPPIIDPSPAEALEDLTKKHNLWVSESLSLKQGFKPGQFIDLPTPKGYQQFRVAGIIKDYTSYEGVFYMNRKYYKELWQDSTVNSVGITVLKNSNVETVRASIEKSLDYDRIFVEPTATYKEKVLKVSAGLMEIFNLIVFVSMLVGAVGVANSLLISVMERAKETGILRSIGMLKREILYMYFIEVSALLLICLILASPLAVGIFKLGALFQLNTNGWVIKASFEWFNLLKITLLISLTSLFSAIYPAWLGSKIEPIQALRSE